MKKLKIPRIKKHPAASEKGRWKFVSFISVNDGFRMEGLNIWNHYWYCSDRKVEVRGPFEGQVYYFKEYEIRTPEKQVRFVAGEFSNGQIGLFGPDELHDEKL